MEVIDWAYYKKGLIATFPPYREVVVDKNLLFKRFKEAFYIRWDSDFDKSDSKNYWHVIKDGEFVLDSLPGKSRNAIRKCLKNCEIKQVDSRYIIENGWYLIIPLILLSLCDDFIKSNKIRSLVRLYKWSR